MDLSYLSEKERESILQVLKRDEDLRKKDEQKLHHLKSELYFLRKRGALRSDLDPESTCSRCRVTLGRVLNRGAVCNSCQSKVCKSCRAYGQSGDEWVCVVCHKQMEIQAASGEWMNEFVRRPSKRRDNKVFIPPADLVKHSIKRSWTSADGFRRNIDTSGAVKETPRQAGPSQVTRNLPRINSRRSVMEQPSRSANQQSSPKMASNIIRVPQPSITAPARPSSRHSGTATPSKPSDNVKSDVVVVEPEPVNPKVTAPSPAPRSLRSLPTPALRTEVEPRSRGSSPTPNPLQRSPVFKHTLPTENERHNSSESQDSGYTTTQQPLISSTGPRNLEMFDSGFDNQGSPRTSKSSGLSRQSSGVSSNKNDWRDPGVESGSASDGSDNEFNNEVVFRKVMVRKKREKEKKMSAVSVVPQDSLKGRGESLSRREVRSWTAEDSGTSTDSKSLPKFTKTAKSGGAPIPQISVCDTADIGSQSIQSNPSGRSSLCSQNTSDKESVPEEDIDRLVALHKTRSSLSSLGNRSDSMTSVYSAAGGGRYGTVDVRGEVYFGLGFNSKLGALEVNVKKCRDLAPVDIKRNRSDPYVKVYLLPDKSKSGKRKTKIKRHTLNPIFDEILRFFITSSELETRTLWLTVWHSDTFGRNDFLGEVMLPFGYAVIDDDSTPKWYLLQERLGPPEEVLSYKGELVLALKYVPQDVTTQKKGKQGKGKLHVLVKEARNLTAVRSNGTSDSFCKCYLLPDKSKNSKQKTQVVKKNCNPKWNHTFVYDDVDIGDLRERCLELTVWDYDRYTSNDFLGGVRLSLGSGRFQGKEVDWLDSRGDEIELWQNMLDKPNVWIDGFILLEPSMEKRPL